MKKENMKYFMLHLVNFNGMIEDKGWIKDSHFQQQPDGSKDYAYCRHKQYGRSVRYFPNLSPVTDHKPQSSMLISLNNY
jgi:hypothetical protein